MLQIQADNSNPNNGFVISYLNLRKAVGILGIALPIVLIIGFALLDKGCSFPPTVSHYFYTNLGTYFTGTLCAVSMFLFSYKGPEKTDARAATIAAICALGVAFFPTNPPRILDNCVKVSLSANLVRNAFHYGFAALLFLTFAYFSLFLFTKTSDIIPTPQKLIRNVIYRSCGLIIIICIMGILLLTILDDQDKLSTQKANIYTFILETIALFAFGSSWLVKGGTILKDKPKETGSIMIS
jgi:hypothetical protein